MSHHSTRSFDIDTAGSQKQKAIQNLTLTHAIRDPELIKLIDGHAFGNRHIEHFNA